MTEPLCIDLYCGLGGWARGFLAEGYRVVGFDIERHDYGTGTYPGQFVIQDVRTLHGSQFKDASVIVASPPCQEYSYRAMPWKRAKALPPPSNELFDACFRIQKEASKAAGKYIPMIVENVCGAQKWVGRAAWHFGSYFLWGDVPALMPFTAGAVKVPSCGDISDHGFNQKAVMQLRRTDLGLGARFTTRDCGIEGVKGFARRFYDTPWAWYGSKSINRKTAAAQIAMIPFPLAQWIARVYRDRA